jgi:iron-sulfur cluster assembly accessory protein
MFQGLKKEEGMENLEQVQPESQYIDEPYTPVTMTPKAVEMVKITREQEGIDAAHGLRIAVRGGGCSGFEYSLDFESEARDNDWIYEQSGLTLYVDSISAKYLEGTNIDYVLGTAGAGFKFNNPQARGTCGCGSSFAV